LPNPLPPSEQLRSQAEIKSAAEADTHGGRVEHRSIACTASLNGFLDWPKVGQVCKLERTRIVNGVSASEIAYAITSLTPAQATPQKLLQLWRGHWGIENRLHWVRDCTFREDACQVKSGHAPQLMAAMRNLAVSLLGVRKVKNRAAELRSHALNPEKCFAALGFKGFA